MPHSRRPSLVLWGPVWRRGKAAGCADPRASLLGLGSRVTRARVGRENAREEACDLLTLSGAVVIAGSMHFLLFWLSVFLFYGGWLVFVFVFFCFVTDFR